MIRVRVRVRVRIRVGDHLGEAGRDGKGRGVDEEEREAGAELADREGHLAGLDLLEADKRLDHPLQPLVGLVQLQRRDVAHALHVTELRPNPLDDLDRRVHAAPLAQQLHLGLGDVVLDVLLPHVAVVSVSQVVHQRKVEEAQVPMHALHAELHLIARVPVVAVVLRHNQQADGDDRRLGLREYRPRLPVARIRSLQAEDEEEREEKGDEHVELPTERVLKRDGDIGAQHRERQHERN